ncbi:sn-glycerol-3-phosphate ABC transporter substrate-binding protein UgpB [Pseudorhodoplanes sinuspersici]|uniref:sn-glycerol-3-phosphate-binding periplasmic protein UgpB n=1 Tax=Pseudorhodoplanes sinuspersici TaxID=1235591 RepID=A0A1W6ZQZ0_9HYPH|nr:sn-glycerol-3-phosphate ABC transporter substrate-binding protein UgpB [Pseudorhodoplanes sinuspersici]ARP99530.1 sn-glycerol-3-phosphate ABC transporter substrate-binding protein [Pseudorhodoplanes sinuspersici]RKE70492.1 carbohydrate ABC transporter substrate-binding protein (CUT1 family) [Pseudorhodoplanes sinuspersici]
MVLRRLAAAICFSVLTAIGPAFALTEIHWWHAMPGELGREVERLASDFNVSQPDYRIIPSYKGLYTETMTAAMVALRGKQHPAILQAAEVATATMMAAKGVVYPVHLLMTEQGVAFTPSAYLPSITSYYSDANGNMLSFPFNSSTPILYYNKDQFRLAGIDADTPPLTWPDVEAAARKLRNKNVPCGVTTGWPAWINIENFSAFHNLPLASLDNGIGGLSTELQFNNLVVTGHLATLAEWQKTKLFDYSGRTNEAERRFYSSECGILISSSAARADIIANAKFEIGYGMLPYWPNVAGAPQNSIIGGGSLWVLQGRPEEEYRGVARFFAFLSRPEVQAAWHQWTGYLPITRAAYEQSRSIGFYDRNPGTDISIKQMTLNPATDHSKGLRLGSYVVVRDIIQEELEAVLSGRKAAKTALDDAVRRGNEILRQFEKSNP